MENNEILMEEDESILTLTDENGEDMRFEYLDCIEYQGIEHLILMPVDEETNEIVILQIEPVDEVGGYPVRSIYSVSDLPDYESYDYRDCPYCKAGQKIDALVNSFGYSAL